jgi:hypothetical protein
MPSSDHFMVVWHQLSGVDVQNGKIYGQLILRADDTGSFASRRLVEFTPASPAFDPATLYRLSFDPFSGRACALLTGERAVTMNYFQVPNAIRTWIPTNK